jgi:alkylated DNA repair protein alkB homolog 1
MAQHLDPHQRPPDELRAAYKDFQRMKPALRQGDTQILDFGRGLTEAQSQKIRVLYHLESDHLAHVFSEFEASRDGPNLSSRHSSPVPVYEHADVPGRPNAFPASCFG